MSATHVDDSYNDYSSMSLPRQKRATDPADDWFKSATLRPNRKKTATVKRRSVIGNMSSRMSMVPMQTFGQPPVHDRKAKKFEIPIVPKMAVNPSRNSTIMDSRNATGGYRSVVSPNGSDYSNVRIGVPLNTFGTDAQLTYAKSMMASMQYPSTSSVDTHRQSTASNGSQTSSGFESMKNGTSSPSNSSLRTSQHSSDCRTSVHSSGSGGSGPSSLASCSVDTLDESFVSSSSFEPSLDVTQMVTKGIPEAEILAIWLDKLGMSEYLSLFLTQGYDLSTIARITPEDLLNVGVANPDHRRTLISEIHTWNITDSWPVISPVGGLNAWLEALALPEYIETFHSQSYNTVQEVITLAWEDLGDIGIKRLGHMKRILLAAKKIKDNRFSNMEYSSNALQRKFPLPPVAVHSPRLQARPLEPANNTGLNGTLSPRMCDPPPPAPSGAYKTKQLTTGIDYFSYSRGCKGVHSDDHISYPTVSRQYDLPMNSTTERKREPLRLNFYGNGQILSEARERDNLSIGGSTTNLDFPPAPAPLAIDSSIRRFQDACTSSVSLGSTSSNSSYEIPFANENCGTIRARDNMHPMAEEPYASLTASTVSRPSILKNTTLRDATLKRKGSYEAMMESLTAELDEVLGPYDRKK